MLLLLQWRPALLYIFTIDIAPEIVIIQPHNDNAETLMLALVQLHDMLLKMSITNHD